MHPEAHFYNAGVRQNTLLQGFIRR